MTVPPASVPTAAEDAGVGRRPELAEHQEDRQGQADVADPVHDERLLGRGGGGRAGVPERDQQVGRQTDALPADVEGHVAVAEDQQQHRRDEQVQVGEEPAAAGVVRHVADRVDVDQRADPGDQQHEDRRQRVEQQPGLRRRASRPEMKVKRSTLDRLPRPAGSWIVQSRPITNATTTVAVPEQVAPAVGAPAAQQQHRGTGERQRDQQPGGRRAARRRAAMSTSVSPSVLQQVGVVDRGGPAGPVDRHDDREPDDDLGRGDDHDEERHDLAVDGAAGRGRR